MLKQQRFNHKIAIAGQVKDAITGRGIPDAVVKIIDAPDEFINFVIFKTKLLGLPSSSMQWRSFNANINPPNPTLPQEIQDFQEQLRNSHLKNVDKLKLFETLLEDRKLNNRDKFQGFQEIIDYFPYNAKAKNSQLGRTQTISDGWFYFMDLPDGLYQLEASLSDPQMRYAKSQHQIEIATKNVKNINIINQDKNLDIFDTINRVKLELKPTTLLGKITNADEKEAIGMAKVQIQGSKEYTFSSTEIIKQSQGEWNYRLIGIEARNTPITVIVSAKGYPIKQKQINLQTGEVKSLDFQLTTN
ncbi:hypothetical protein H6G54_26855 [Anabaena cylindrica FACHB-243]|uniref:Carboxypeptidase regulatory-like domain-containing protein n=1 Tax=Anabaena cylindrica (strain ATCC 27899 / PCC 7122) TaxID=272123 RepID=K9Z9E1_ANACC|nr:MULTISPECIES: hypothetical protein [Anabaena]AFZ55813.1 hypothetical protein Anacy_0206 [Anabaena cylindrica PCC 7122]MBD2421236.1 hypothetical protein [Anabaena cylindrica FACHB-243]MBY5284149.1 carboxypeptidase-like regulatory domain-containing protein [Anabaena sp. CCAP 1446/1C]MBY5308067.1 carboxypeptidase-like regulatory domain-containing protein [Anabaena sp. CCAP 1446/1C]MCM2406567.1 carboxypeptidase-like regulatory domain-containing protein [Anabaena sp. CCAP 1446/1C]